MSDAVFYSPRRAFKDGLIQLTKWLSPTPDNVKYLIGEHNRINQDPNRIAMLVKSKTSCRIALFVNPVAPMAEGEDDGEGSN